jgi:hypothetical protein
MSHAKLRQLVAMLALQTNANFFLAVTMNHIFAQAGQTQEDVQQMLRLGPWLRPRERAASQRVPLAATTALVLTAMNIPPDARTTITMDTNVFSKMHTTPKGMDNPTH